MPLSARIGMMDDVGEINGFSLKKVIGVAICPLWKLSTLHDARLCIGL
jgi:hypothetical protein